MKQNNYVTILIAYMQSELLVITNMILSIIQYYSLRESFLLRTQHEMRYLNVESLFDITEESRVQVKASKSHWIASEATEA